MAQDRLFLVDAMALAYRAHFAFINRPLINSKGFETSAIYGFTTSLIRLLDQNPEHIAVVFDPPGKTFRADLFTAYKAHRPEMPEPLQEAIPYIKQIVQGFDIPVVECPGVEADDVIGTLARRAETEDVDVIIVSPDKDFRQLLSKHVSIMRPSRRGEEFEIMTEESFQAQYGVDPIQFIDILALLGDASDNVPGVRGIGAKTAPTLIQTYGSVENLLEHAEEIKGKRVREGLLNHKQDALLSKQLVTILTDVELDLDWHTLRRTEPHFDQLTSLFKELEFRSVMNRVMGKTRQRAAPDTDDPALSFDFGPYEAIKTYDPEAVNYHIIRNEAGLKDLIQKLSTVSALAFDTETTSTDVMWASLVGCSLAWETGTAYYVPTPLPDGTSTETVVDYLRPVLGDPSVKLIGQNLKYDEVVMARHGAELAGQVFDTMIAHYLITPEEAHNLDAIASTYLNYKPIPISDLIGTGKNQRSMRDVPLEQVGPYACEDADVTLQLASVLAEKLEADGLTEMAENMEFPLSSILAGMERTGIKLNQGILADISTQLKSKLDALEREIFEHTGELFNIASPKQLGQILFEKIGLKPLRKTSTGQASTNERVLSQLATEHPLPGLVLDWRHLAKLKNTYVDTLGGLIHPETGRIHTSFNQTITATGRLSSSNPNMQNIPVRSGIGREIRKAFVAEEGHVLLAADYVQIELRILAHMSKDPGFVTAFAEGADIHTATAALINKVKPEDVDRDMRRKAKEVNYGIPYGISVYELGQRLRVDYEEAKELMDQYHQTYPAVNQLNHQLIEHAKKKGYVETLLGRRRYIPTINAANQRERSAAERMAVNMPIQGTQADMIKLAMVRIDRRLKAEARKSKMILQVHDELVFEVPLNEREAMTQLIQEEMAAALPLDVPVEVDVGEGPNWLDAH